LERNGAHADSHPRLEVKRKRAISDPVKKEPKGIDLQRPQGGPKRVGWFAMSKEKWKTRTPCSTGARSVYEKRNGEKNNPLGGRRPEFVSRKKKIWPTCINQKKKEEMAQR